MSQASPKKRPAKKTSSRLQSDRLAVIELWLLEGATAAQIERHSRQLWRMPAPRTRRYVRCIRRRWLRAARRTDYLCHLWKACRQREHFLDQLLRDLRRTEQPPAILLRAFALVHQLLRERDQIMHRLVAYRRQSGRDASPDATERRGDVIVWPAAEWQQRLEHLRQILRLETTGPAAVQTLATSDQSPPSGGVAE